MAEATEVTVRELRNRGGEVIDRVAAGERLVVTRDGRAVARLTPLARRPLPPTELLARWKSLPLLDAASLRADLDRIVDPAL